MGNFLPPVALPASTGVALSERVFLLTHSAEFDEDFCQRANNESMLMP